MRKRWILLFPFVLVALGSAVLPAARPARAATITLTTCNVSELVTAINTANADPAADTIALRGDCTYSFSSPQPASILALPPIGTDITIQGNGATLARAAGAPELAFFDVLSAGALHLDRLTIRDGLNSFCGGAIASDGVLVISNSSFENNHIATTGNGGALCVLGGSLSIASSRFIGNGVTTFSGPARGGALAIFNTTTVTIDRSFFSGNAADNGGAIYYVGAASLAVSNSTFDGNVAGLRGGGIYAAAPMTLLNSTVSHNQTIDPLTTTAGGGLSGAPTGVITAKNTLVAANTNWLNVITDCDAAAINSTPANNIATSTSCGAGFASVAGAMIGVPALNGGPTETVPLLPGSPAIDGGSNTICTTAPVSGRDQRGATRPFDGDGNGSAICDVGAYEYVASDHTAPTAAPTSFPAANGAGWNRTDVTVTWNWNDGAGLDSTNCTGSSVSSGEGAAITLSATCTDLAGNSGSASTTVKVDKTKPVSAITTTPGVGDSVSVSLSATDGGSGVAALEYDLDGDGWTTAPPTPLVVTNPAQHELRYRAKDVAGNIETARTPAATTPTGFAFSTVTGSSATAVWSDTTGETNYYLVTTLDNGATYTFTLLNQNVVSSTVSGIPNNTRVYAWLTACAFDQCSAYVGAINAFVTTDVAPATPTGFHQTGTASPDGFTWNVTAGWNDSGGETAYQLVWSQDGAIYTTIDLPADSSSSTFSSAVMGFPPGSLVYAWLRACNGNACSGYAGAIALLAGGGITPDVPTNLHAGLVTDSSIQVLWTAPALANYYQVGYSLNNGATWSFATSPSSDYTLTGLLAGKRVYFTVRACIGNDFHCSAFVPAIRVTTLDGENDPLFTSGGRNGAGRRPAPEPADRQVVLPKPATPVSPAAPTGISAPRAGATRRPTPVMNVAAPPPPPVRNAKPARGATPTSTSNNGAAAQPTGASTPSPARGTR